VHSSQVQDNPDGEPDDVENNEYARSSETRNAVADTIRQRALMQRLIFETRDGANISRW
jgi:hypothetical protein